MKFRKLIVIGVTAGLIAAMTACGSGSGDSGVASSSKQITGAITAFGSVYVNGTKYDTDNAEVYVEGSKASESDLRVGMMVTVKESSTGVAASIHFGDDVEGMVISTNIAADGTGSLNVMGQTVTVDSSTIFESHVNTITTMTGVGAGNIVEVSGSSSGTGSITATRLEVKAISMADYIALGKAIEVKGIVAAHDEVSTFKIGEMVVSYSTADITDMPAGNWDGLYVEAKSMQDLNASDQLVASKVELENEGSKGPHGDDEDEVEVSGEVTEVTASSVTVNGQTFLHDADTQYEHGTLADLIVGAMVEVEGHFNGDGDLVADEVEFKDHESEDEIEGYVEAIVLTGLNEGTIVVGVYTIVVNNDTLMHDSSTHHDMSFNLSMLAVDDFVEVHMVDNGDGTFTATKLEREIVAAPPL